MSNTTGAIVVFGGIFLAGGAIGYAFGEKSADSALEWALSKTSECEQSYVADGYDNVTECLKFAIWAAEDEREIDPG